MEFLIEVATYFEEERNFQANCSFLRGALNFFATDGKTTTTTSPSADDVLSLQIKTLNVGQQFASFWRRENSHFEFPV
jgi:hypothetical protein